MLRQELIELIHSEYGISRFTAAAMVDVPRSFWGGKSLKEVASLNPDVAIDVVENHFFYISSSSTVGVHR